MKPWSDMSDAELDARIWEGILRIQNLYYHIVNEGRRDEAPGGGGMGVVLAGSRQGGIDSQQQGALLD